MHISHRVVDRNASFITRGVIHDCECIDHLRSCHCAAGVQCSSYYDIEDGSNIRLSETGCRLAPSSPSFTCKGIESQMRWRNRGTVSWITSSYARNPCINFSVTSSISRESEIDVKECWRWRMNTCISTVFYSEINCEIIDSLVPIRCYCS